MIKKTIFLTLFLLLMSPSFLAAAEPELAEIQGLIAAGKTEEALKILEKSDTSSNPDLKFYKALLLSWQEDYQEAEEILLELIESNPQRLDSYNQLARIYGWQRKFEQAEEIIARAQKIKYSSERTAILSKHQEWQENFFKAEKLIKEAVRKAESPELAAQYQDSLKKIERELKTIFYLEGRALYSEADKEDLELAVGLEKPLSEGVNIEAAVGGNYFENESNFLIKSKLELNQPLISEKTAFSSELLLYNGETKDNYQLNNNFDYLIDEQNLVGFNYNLVENNKKSDYQSLELEYEHRFKKIIMVLKNSSRRYDADWTADFSQHLDLYYPRENYLINLALSHYNDGEYVFKVGFEFSDLFSGEKFSLSSLNLWFNDQQTSNLDFRMDLK